ncbi:hypothetical protein ACQR35_08800 [Pseudarthrobacter sp. J1738]|uniref:hypothetical protein n=1 Tax=Pseudarthrobacter sp. J1738 TaxID=3420446 RepID=UPI003D297DFF
MGTSFTVDYRSLSAKAGQIESIAMLLGCFLPFTLDESRSLSIANSVRTSGELTDTTLKNFGDEFMSIARDVREAAVSYASTEGPASGDASYSLPAARSGLGQVQAMS